jgi:hypothetical protein
MGKTQVTVDMFWDGSPRPPWVNNQVVITLESFSPSRALSNNRNLVGETRWRPLYVQGLILPVTTTGRGDAPPPVSGHTTSKYPEDKGHLMAVELGGPDIGSNIIPQARFLNEHGPWRKMETLMKNQALLVMGKSMAPHPSEWWEQSPPSKALLFTVSVEYGQYQPAIPIRLDVAVFVVHKTWNYAKSFQADYSDSFENTYHPIKDLKSTEEEETVFQQRQTTLFGTTQPTGFQPTSMFTQNTLPKNPFGNIDSPFGKK